MTDAIKTVIPHLTVMQSGPLPSQWLCVRHAYDMAMEGRSKLSTDHFNVAGFSGRKFRMFLNNLFEIMDDGRYLEIGVFNGGSFVPALAGNKISGTALDNWSWDGANFPLFEENLKLVGDDAQASIINKDFVDVDYSAIGKFNVLFYDGSHSEEHQYLGVKLPSPALDPQAIVMVDDWNWEQVRRGTYAGLRDAGRTILCSLEIRTTLHNREDLPPFAGSQSDWHNGLFVALTQTN